MNLGRAGKRRVEDWRLCSFHVQVCLRGLWGGLCVRGCVHMYDCVFLFIYVFSRLLGEHFKRNALELKAFHLQACAHSGNQAKHATVHRMSTWTRSMCISRCIASFLNHCDSLCLAVAGSISFSPCRRLKPWKHTEATKLHWRDALSRAMHLAHCQSSMTRAGL